MTNLSFDCLGNHCHGNHMAFYDESDFEPDRSVGYLVRRVFQLGNLGLEPVFAAEGLSGIQWQTLVTIWFGRGATCAELARDLGHDKGAMTRLVDGLEARGWVERRRDTGDRRRIELVLTPAGEAIALAAKRRVIGCWNGWLADWDHGDIETLIALLTRLRTTLSKADTICG